MFNKGHQKKGGRKAGTPNKATSDLKSRIATLLDQEFDTISNDLDLLEPKERVTAYIKLMEYVIPKQREQRIDLSTLSDEQLDDLIHKLLNKVD